MTQTQQLEREFALEGIRAHIDPGLETFLLNGIEHRQAAGMLKPTRCAGCDRILSRPESILRGYGPECEAKILAERAAGERLPVGCEVRVVAGAYEGAQGVISSYVPRRGKRAAKQLFLVEFGGYRGRYTADQLERVEVFA